MQLLNIVVIVFSLILVYFLGSTLVSMVLELYNTMRNKREKFLKKMLEEKLGPATAEGIMGHSMVSGTAKGGTSRIDPTVFGYVANQQLDKDENRVLHSAMAAYGGKTTATTPTDPSGTDTEEAPDAETTTENTSGTESSTSTATADTTSRDALSAWFQDFSKDMTAQYKSSLRLPSLIISALVVILLNLDTLNIVRTLWENPQDSEEVLATLRQVDWASLATEPNPGDTATLSQNIEDIQLILSKFDTLQSAGLPIGWKSGEQLGMVIPAQDTVVQIQFRRLMQVDTTGGGADTSYTFAYLPPTGAAVYQPQGRIAAPDPQLLALFPSAIPQPHPQLSQAGDRLQLDFSGVFGGREVDSLSAQFTGIDGDEYAFQTAAHAEEVEPSALAVMMANLCTLSWASLFGWFISIIAISQGAPFWFDVLKRLSSYLTKAED